MKDYRSFKKRLLQDQDVKKAYHQLGSEFAVVEELIEKRLSHGLTQQQLAKKIGTKQPVISRFESGTYNPTIKFLQRITHALGLRLRISVS